MIAWRCGSVAEIVEDGKTGFIVDSEDEAVRAVGRLDKLDAGSCAGCSRSGSPRT